MREMRVGGNFQLLLEAAHERDVLFEHLLVARTELCRDALQVRAHIVEDAHEAVLVLHLAVELLEHPIRIIDRRDGLVAAEVAHARPRVRAVRHRDAEFHRAEACLCLRFALEEFFDLLVNRDAARPACGISAAAHDVARQQFGAREQTAHAAHVAVAVAADFVVNALQHERPVLERRERFEDGFESEIPRGVRPEFVGQCAIRREHDDQPLATLRKRRPGERGQAREEWQRGGGDSEVAEELAAVEVHHGNV